MVLILYNYVILLLEKRFLPSTEFSSFMSEATYTLIMLHYTVHLMYNAVSRLYIRNRESFTIFLLKLVFLVRDVTARHVVPQYTGAFQQEVSKPGTSHE